MASKLHEAFAFSAKWFRGKRPPSCIERGPQAWTLCDAEFMLDPRKAGEGSYDPLRGEDRDERFALYEAVHTEAGLISPLARERGEKLAAEAAERAAQTAAYRLRRQQEELAEELAAPLQAAYWERLRAEERRARLRADAELAADDAIRAQCTGHLLGGEDD